MRHYFEQIPCENWIVTRVTILPTSNRHPSYHIQDLIWAG